MRRMTCKEAKATVVFSTILLLLTCFTTACQPTPESEIVVNKNNDAQNQQTMVTTAQPFSAPEQWTDSYEYYDGKVVVNIDADVITPQTESFNVYALVPALFTQAQAEKLTAVFFGDAELESLGQQWTKAQYEELLLHYQASYASGDMGITQEEYEASVKDLEERWTNAPETVVKLDPREQIQAFSESGRLSLQADMGRGAKASLLIVNADEGYDSSVKFENNDGQKYGALPMGDGEITLVVAREEAQSQAEALLSDLQINDMDMAAVKIGFAYAGGEGDSVSGAPQCYLFYFTRSVESVPSTYDDRTGDATDSDDYDRTWAYERIVVGVDDDGIVQFSWDGNAEITQIVEANVQLMSFDELMDTFKTNMGIRYAYTEDSEVMNSTYQIVKISLGITRIKTADGYRLVPIWDFFGAVQMTTEQGEVLKITEDGSDECQSIMSFLTINAIDGSVIDRSVGY